IYPPLFIHLFIHLSIYTPYILSSTIVYITSYLPSRYSPQKNHQNHLIITGNYLLVARIYLYLRRKEGILNYIECLGPRSEHRPTPVVQGVSWHVCNPHPPSPGSERGGGLRHARAGTCLRRRCCR
ncbi:hypothetical protein F5879DRAFT_978611, partial [Lentinula edodes]